MRVALVHDWITGMRGGERCLEALLALFPDAHIYTLLHITGKTTAQIDSQVRGTSFFQKIPGASKYYRHLLPLYPLAAASLKLQGYDLIISVSHAAAKNITVPKDTLHISYCLTPMRYIWDQVDYYFGWKRALIWPLVTHLRSWDRQKSSGVTKFACISRFVAARIRKYYNRKAEVIYPPVDSERIQSYLPTHGVSKADNFLYAGALVPYKRPDLVIKAFNQLKLPLVVVGSGPEEKRLKRMARSNVKFVGQVSDADLALHYAKARALVFPGTEDFGIVPLECMAAGTPVIALYDGALKETHLGIRHWQKWTKSSNLSSLANLYLDAEQATGVFIEQAPKDQLGALKRAILSFVESETKFRAAVCRAQAEKFVPGRFYNEWVSLLTELGVQGLTSYRAELSAARVS